MSFTHIKNSFIAGELSPAIYGRTDLAKYQLGATTCRNFFVGYRGGAYSRPGLAFVGMCKQGAPNSGGTATSNPPRDINFQFNNYQGFALEFGDNYMRIKSNGAYVTEAALNVTNITQANPGVITITAHGFSNNDWLFGQNIGGMTALNGVTGIVQNVTTDTFTLTDLFGNPINTNVMTAYASGGTFSRIYTLATPYAAIDLDYLKFVQSADTMTLDCVNPNTLTGLPPVEYPSYNLVRNGAASYSLNQITYASPITAPTNAAATAQSSTTANMFYSYVVTAVDSAGNESVASNAASVENNDISVNAGSNTITWSPVAGAVYYNIYASTPSFMAPVPVGVNYGFLGEAFGTSFTDTNIQADFTDTPPTHQDPFARGQIIGVVVTAPGSGLTQSTVGYTVTTSTGTGFVGSPIVLNGALVGFLIDNTGKNYANTDTITITGSTATSATGTYNFTNANPTNNQTIILNGVTWTFKTSGATGNQTNIQGSLASTIAQLVINLNASVNSSINVATYSSSGNQLVITYGTTGTAGNAYTLAAGTYAGIPSGATLTGGSAAGGSGGAAVSLEFGAQTGTYPAVPAYLFQRAVQANTLNDPDTYFMSKPGQYLNMDSSIPITDGDAIIGNPWAQQVNGIQFITPMLSAAVVFTGGGTWLLSGGGGVGTPFTPTSQQATPQEYNGCSSTVQPIPVNSEIIYLQSLGSIVRDLSYNYFTQRCTSVDVTVLSSHLFEGFQITQWAYAQNPYYLFWCIRSDGTALSFTFIKEQEVQAWARHDTNGLFMGVCTVTEPPVNAVYWIVKRFINGVWCFYSERFDNRLWENVEDCFCVDSGLSYPMSKPNATLTPAATNGTSNISSTQVVLGGNYPNLDAIAMAVDASNQGTGATFAITYSGTSISAVTPINQGLNYTPGQTTIVITSPTGGTGAIVNPFITNIIEFTASSGVFNAGMIGDVIRSGNGKATITSYVSATQVMADVTQPITAIVPNDPNNTPIPQTSGNWTVSVPTSIVTGLNHLIGMEVAILADGGVVQNQIVRNFGNGTVGVTLNQPASSITVGLPFLPQIQTMYLDPPAQSTTQSKRKSINAVSVRVQNTAGISAGTNQPDQATTPGGGNPAWSNMTQIKMRNSSVLMGQPVQLQSDDFYIPVQGAWDEKGRVAIEQPYPIAANISALVIYYNVGDSAG